MRCRKIQDGEVIWFGSAGKNQDGTAKLVYNQEELYQNLRSQNKSVRDNAFNTFTKSKYNFADNQEGVANSLTQRLSVIKKELWYRMSYGLPLFDKVKSKVFMDSEITQIIMSHPEVTRIIKFNSKVLNKNYTYEAVILTTYGELELNSRRIEV